jgi:hypothetical protein
MMNYSPSRRRAIARLFGAAACTAVGITLALPPRAAAAEAAHVPGHHRPANAVVHWNGVASEAFAPSQGTNALAQSRTLAILHASIHDALNAIDRRYEPHTPGLVAAPKASADAAVAAASREVLVRLLPEQAALVETAYGQALARLREGRARTAGIAIGQAAAWATLNRRQNDGAEAATQPVYVPGSTAGDYQFTAPFDFAGLPGWGRVQPFVIEVREHALEGPLALTSAAYARDVAEVKAVGHAASTARSAEQSQIASFWYEDSPLGWNRIAAIVVRQRGLDNWEAARAFALLHFAMADGFIAGFDQKYRHRFWRPLTAIHAAASDGNPLTAPDAAWQPMLVTPPVPDYPSTHTVLGWAASEVLGELFGDRTPFAATSLTLPGVTRHYRSFAQAAHENGLSRLYAGIHFRHAIQDGRRQGRAIGRSVAGALAPVR